MGVVTSYLCLKDLQSWLKRYTPPGLPPGIRIRTADPIADRATLAAVVEAWRLDTGSLGAEPLDYQPRRGGRETIVPFLAPHVFFEPAGTFFACHGEQVIGAAVGSFAPAWDENAPEPVGSVELLWVHPDYRRRGLGGELLWRVVHWLAEQGATRVVVSPQTRLVERILREHGFVECAPPRTNGKTQQFPGKHEG